MACLNLERLYSYLEGELEALEKKDFEAHLASCPKCRDAVEERRRLAEAVRTLPPFEVPADFAQKIMDRISPLPAKVTLLSWLAAAAAGLATFVVMLTAAALLTGHSLSQLLLGLSRFTWNNIQSLSFFLIKIAKYILLIFKILAQISREIIEGFKVLTSFIGPEAQIIFVCVTFILIITGGFLWSRKLSVEKDYEK
jgi:predicted anti-sigma-YlaC factor YlaD